MLRSAITLTLLLGTLNFVCASASASEVYKYTDEKGNVLYTDKPRTLPAERMNVQTTKVDPAAQARQNEEMKRMQDADNARKQQSAQQSSQSNAAPMNAKDRSERCTKARDRYDTYMNSQKLYEEKTGGERHYLTSEELDAARASAKANMDIWCK
jgi:Domain of unknown function (DUF4124)